MYYMFNSISNKFGIKKKILAIKYPIIPKNNEKVLLNVYEKKIKRPRQNPLSQTPKYSKYNRIYMLLNISYVSKT
jgi:hypothetical protein